MKNIVVPCDFSTPSRNAFRFALSIAARSGGTIHLLHVIELPVLISPLPVAIPDYQGELRRELESNAEAELNKLSFEYNSEGIKVLHSIQFGALEKTLLHYIVTQDIDLVVLGSHGASGLRDIVLGSNAEKLIRHSPVPVFVIKDLFVGPITKIVLPVPYSQKHQSVFTEKVLELQEFFKATLHLLWVNTPANFTPDTETKKMLDQFIERWGVNRYATHIFNHRTEEEGILEFTRMINGDLIAMSTHGRKGLAHIVAGSLTEDLVNHTTNLVWTFAAENVHEPA
jgi:nucleotide-binding universal stress UspA family protein